MKRAGTSSGGALVAQVAALQMVQQDLSTYSPEYSPTSPSPPRHRVTGAKVDMGKGLTPPLDRNGTDLQPGSVRRHIRPPPIRRPPEIHAYTDSDDDDEEGEEEEPNDIASLREQLATLLTRNDHTPSPRAPYAKLGLHLTQTKACQSI